MDVAKLKSKLDALNDDSQRGGNDFSDKFWTPQLGNSVIRIVPSMKDPDDPFTELTFHSTKGMVKYPILALSNFGKQDPIEEFIKELRSTSDKSNWSLSGKISPKTRYFCPVIVRGEEEKGVRLWNIGITMYKALLQLASNEEIGDYTDIVNGRDITVTKVKGDPYPETTIMPRMSVSPLSKDSAEAEKWLHNQPNPVECYKQYDYDFIKKLLQSYLSGKPVEADKKESNPVVEAGEKILEKQAAAKEEYKVVTAPTPKPKVAPKSVTSKFDDLFSDDEPAVEDDIDKLPF